MGPLMNHVWLGPGVCVFVTQGKLNSLGLIIPSANKVGEREYSKGTFRPSVCNNLVDTLH